MPTKGKIGKKTASEKPRDTIGVQLEGGTAHCGKGRQRKREISPRIATR